jgi:hypothetical protein
MYAAPEQKIRGSTADHRGDIFALGLILNQMFTGNYSVGSWVSSHCQRRSVSWLLG